MPNRRGGRGRRSEDELLSDLLQRLAREDREAFDALMKFLARILPVKKRRYKVVDKT